ncbi:hypothetical protein EON65_44445 [archaeon]|nr:MAG: hypothetical protein EON65_44445 [archaeon]
MANQSVCGCCASFDKLYTDSRLPLPTTSIELPITDPDEATKARRESIVRKEKKDIGDIVNRVVNDRDTGDDSQFDLHRPEPSSDDAFYAVETTNTENHV